MPVQLISKVHWNTSGITHGQQANASNTGIAGVGLTAGDLTSAPGQHYTTNNQIIEGLRFTGDNTVWLEGDGIILRKCLFDFAGTGGSYGLKIQGADCIVEDCTFAPATGSSYYIGIVVGDSLNAARTIVRRTNIGNCQNALTLQSDDVVIDRCYLHHGNTISDPGGHIDFIELYGGNRVTIQRSRVGDTTLTDDAAINITPFFSGVSIDDVTIQDCFLDGGTEHVLVAVQAPAVDVTRVKLFRNKMGGHTVGVGSYNAVSNALGGIAHTAGEQATSPHNVWVPITGPDVNYWDECTGLTPDRTGEIVNP